MANTVHVIIGLLFIAQTYIIYIGDFLLIIKTYKYKVKENNFKGHHLLWHNKCARVGQRELEYQFSPRAK